MLETVVGTALGFRETEQNSATMQQIAYTLDVEARTHGKFPTETYSGHTQIQGAIGVSQPFHWRVDGCQLSRTLSRRAEP